MRRGTWVFAMILFCSAVFFSCSRKQELQNAIVVNSQKESEESTSEKSVTLYDSDGKMCEIPESQVGDYKSAGWHTEPVCIMYSTDGRTQVVLQSQIEANKAVGWYTQPVIPSLTELCSYRWKRNGVTLSACYEYTFFTDGEYERNGVATGYENGKYTYDNGILKIYCKNNVIEFEYSWQNSSFINPNQNVLAEKAYRDKNGVFHGEVYKTEDLVKGNRMEPQPKPTGINNLSEYIEVYNCCLNGHYIEATGKAINWPYDMEYYSGDFYEVEDPNISTILELKNYLLKYMSAKTVDKYLSIWQDDMSPVLERDGHLYVEYPARGSMYIDSSEGRIIDSSNGGNKIVYTFPLYNSGDQYCEDVTLTFVKEDGVYKIDD